VLQNVALTQAAADEQVDPDTLVRTENLEVVRLFDGRDEAQGAGNIQFLGLMVVRILREGRFQAFDERVLVLADFPQEFSLVRQFLDVLSVAVIRRGWDPTALPGEAQR
jgi:hypothetical protein